MSVRLCLQVVQNLCCIAQVGWLPCVAAVLLRQFMRLQHRGKLCWLPHEYSSRDPP